MCNPVVAYLLEEVQLGVLQGHVMSRPGMANHPVASCGDHILVDVKTRGLQQALLHQ
jgi:hypothetical protein